MNLNQFLDNLTLPDWKIAVPTALGFAVLVYVLRLMTLSGSIATFGIGAVIFGMGGGKFALPLLTFFLTSSLLSRIGKARKAPMEENVAKGAKRDVWQALANGLAATVIVFIFWLMKDKWAIDNLRCLLLLYLAALATVNSDTWATEIGGIFGGTPRSLRNWQEVPKGESGAISIAGTIASLLGSLAITLAGWLVWRLNVVEFLIVAWAGFLGSFVDSLLGASVQAAYRHPETYALTEKTSINGVKTEKIRGISWMNNDMVNFLASVCGVLCALLLWKYALMPFR